MLKCWEENPRDRPTFAKLKETTKEMERNRKVSSAKGICCNMSFIFSDANLINVLFFFVGLVCKIFVRLFHSFAFDALMHTLFVKVSCRTLIIAIFKIVAN